LKVTSISPPELSPTSTCQPSPGEVPWSRAVRPVQDTVTVPAAPDQVRVSVCTGDEAAVFEGEPPGRVDVGVADGVRDGRVVARGPAGDVRVARGPCFGECVRVGAAPIVPTTAGCVWSGVGLPVTWLPARSIATQVSAEPAITTTTHAVTARNHIRLLT